MKGIAFANIPYANCGTLRFFFSKLHAKKLQLKVHNYTDACLGLERQKGLEWPSILLIMIKCKFRSSKLCVQGAFL